MDGSGGGASFSYDLAGNRLQIETKSNDKGKAAENSNRAVKGTPSTFPKSSEYSAMSTIEGRVRRAVESGQVVQYTSAPTYSGSNPMPIGITITATGDGGFSVYETVLNRR